METLIGHLLRIAVAMTGYSAPASLPDVYIVSQEVMPCACLAAMLYPRKMVSYGHPIHLPTRIFLDDSVDPRSGFGKSVLLHELVHVLQATEGATQFGTATWHAREREAYKVQTRYLMENGIDMPRRFGLAAGGE